ncbi:MAG: iron dicitrate transporter FecR [Porticoccaceae bacterium]|nr:MAG: iron dicitrate transporter FecR [Porticoccaceae bacterium]
MAEVHRLPSRIAAEAADWVVKLDRGLRGDERARLETWLAADPRHAAALLRLAALWDRLDALQSLAELLPPGGARRNRLPAFAALLLAGLAATLLALLAPAPPGPPPAEWHYQTALGERKEIALPDGSHLTLNTASRVRVRFAPRLREIDLEAGELFLHVARDPARPLEVRAAGRAIRALGTAFAVALREDRVELVVAEGRVRVEGAGPPRALAAGEAARLGVRAVRVESLADGELEARLAWREGRLIFRGEPLGEAIRQVERYAPVRFAIADPELAAVRVAGLFRTGDVAGLLAALEANFAIAHRRLADGRILLSRKRS